VDGGAEYPGVVAWIHPRRELGWLASSTSWLRQEAEEAASSLSRTFVSEPFILLFFFSTEKYRSHGVRPCLDTTGKNGIAEALKTAGVTRVGPPAEFP
jgi:hypothetical protein